MDELKSDFRNFLWVVWQTLGLPEPSWLQYDMANEIQSSTEHLILEALRGAGKSYLCAAAACWDLYRDPDIKIMFVSGAANRARESLMLCRKIIGGCELLNHLIPPDGALDGNERFDVGSQTKAAKDPSVCAYGIRSMITGAHVDRIYGDDVETPENSATIEARESLYKKILEFENILNPGGRIIMPGTPQTEESVYNRLAEHYRLLRYPARFTDPADPRTSHGLAPSLVRAVESGEKQVGDPTYPERFPDHILVEREAVMGPTIFGLQMMLDTSLADAGRYPLKLRDLVVLPTSLDSAPTQVVWGTQNRVADIESVGLQGDRFYHPAWMNNEIRPFERTVMFIDPAGRGQDKTGVAVGRLLNGQVFVPYVNGFAGGYETDTLEAIAKVVLTYKVKTIRVESNFGDGMFNALLAPVVARICGPVEIIEERSTGQKELRIIDRLEPAMNQHRVVIDPQVARNKDLMMQLTRITKVRGALRHDDELEALAGAVGMFIDNMSVDIVKRAAEIKEQERIQAVREYMESWKKPETIRIPLAGGASPQYEPLKSRNPLRSNRNGRGWIK